MLTHNYCFLVLLILCIVMKKKLNPLLCNVMNFSIEAAEAKVRQNESWLFLFQKSHKILNRIREENKAYSATFCGNLKLKNS